MTSTPPAQPPPGDLAGPPDWDAEEAAVEERLRSARGSRRWWVVGAVAVLVGTVLATIWGLSATVGRVGWVDSGHEVVSDTQVDVRFDVRRDPAREVVCRLEARDSGSVVVGRTEVTVAPGESSPSRHVESVRTASPAVTGYVDECWYPEDGPRH
ncbi:DUF4307 domain-containing protein [Ornithinimicrobium flavum]|uniref:DUF4307 domain-containing protein n=1 Tax=Ornithinimicrobium flavum TaxID=1288636 RepID=UPI00130546B9|nr:DUF4307 domain-containing protein [Ornithinimicrobium flavum]